MKRSDRQGASDSATRWTIWISLVIVSVGAAWPSYIHALAVVQAADGPKAVSYFIAGLADPAIFAASVNIFDASRRGAPRPVWSFVSIGVSVFVTLSANIAAGSPHSIPSPLVNVWPPVTFLLALESLTSYLRRGRGGEPGGQSAPAAQPDETGDPPSTDEALRVLLGPGSIRGLADELGVPKSRVETWKARLSRPGPGLAGPELAEPELPEPELAGAALNGASA